MLNSGLDRPLGTNEGEHARIRQMPMQTAQHRKKKSPMYGLSDSEMECDVEVSQRFGRAGVARVLELPVSCPNTIDAGVCPLECGKTGSKNVECATDDE